MDKVADELAARSDQLSQWAAQRGAGFFLRPDPSVIPALQSLSGWASGGSYEPSAVTEFLQDADYYLIAHAKVHGHVVVTHEVPSASKKKIKIPEACINAGVKYITPFEMLRLERARFVLEQ